MQILSASQNKNTTMDTMANEFLELMPNSSRTPDAIKSKLGSLRKDWNLRKDKQECHTGIKGVEVEAIYSENDEKEDEETEEEEPSVRTIERTPVVPLRAKRENDSLSSPSTSPVASTSSSPSSSSKKPRTSETTEQDNPIYLQCNSIQSMAASSSLVLSPLVFKN
jgi:hypothetical protein